MGLRGNQRKKSWSWGENTLLRPGFFQQVESTCPHQTLALEKSLSRKGREPSPAGSEAIPRLCSSQICLWREIMCVVRGGEHRGWGLWKEACELSLQPGRNSKVLPCGNWGFFFKTISPGNIFLDCCTSIKKHDHSNYRRWDEEWCIWSQPGKIQSDFFSKILSEKERKSQPILRTAYTSAISVCSKPDHGSV